ncbi:MAG TPA: 4'-phosphopantetheinyl transferase superfamily protein [Candidatus Acidoferrum sp.]|nr:4'-phosphopantetheinyl transferase superfamily protein [Candidatus Methylomirabilis sp.]HWU41356.1 4'-phosphopantetheinyl transferase superfamily protein [Candidatus Acidoferrum sp.]
MPGCRLRFNLTHSHGVGLYAFTTGAEVGVDLERVHPHPDLERIADRFFAPGEALSLRALPRSVKPAAFFACWTRKEALLKARGEGIGDALRRLEVSMDPGEEVVALHFPGCPGGIASLLYRESPAWPRLGGPDEVMTMVPPGGMCDLMTFSVRVRGGKKGQRYPGMNEGNRSRSRPGGSRFVGRAHAHEWPITRSGVVSRAAPVCSWR